MNLPYILAKPLKNRGARGRNRTSDTAIFKCRACAQDQGLGGARVGKPGRFLAAFEPFWKTAHAILLRMERPIRALVFAILLGACAPAPVTPACRAIDGDTIECAGAARVRLVNIDAPELRGRCALESELAARARAFVAARLAEGVVTIRPDPRRPRDRFGRTLAWVAVDGADLGEALIAEGLARRWDGRRRAWCP
jgi:micrococcal nuclease